VFSSTGHRQPETITSTFITSPMPATSMRIGTRTGGGTARRNSNSGSTTARSVRFAPTSMPSPMPSTSAAA
jgi:hypothetical protein